MNREINTKFFFYFQIINYHNQYETVVLSHAICRALLERGAADRKALHSTPEKRDNYFNL